MVSPKDDHAIPDSIVQRCYQHHQLLHFMTTHVFGHIPPLSPPAYIVEPLKKPFTNLQMR